MKLKDLLLEAEVETSIEDVLDQVTSDLAKVDIDENNTNEAVGLTLAGVALYVGEIVKLVGKFINLLSKIPGLKKLSGDKLVALGEKYHSKITSVILKVVMKAGVKDKEKALKFANNIHMLVVAGLLVAGLGPMALKFSKGKYAGATFKAALNAIKAGEIGPYLRQLKII